jgi:hypothetical protein
MKKNKIYFFESIFFQYNFKIKNEKGNLGLALNLNNKHFYP